MNTIPELIIDDAGQVLLDTPTYSGSSGNLYSGDQMVHMFIAGFKSALCKMNTAKEKKNIRPYNVMKNMSVGQIVEFTQDKHNAARSAASLLKKQFGSIFLVRKITANREGVIIQVRRNS